MATITESSARAADVVLIHPADNVCIAVRNLPAGVRVSAGGRTVELTTAVNMGHKIALAKIAKGDCVTRYGQTIGFATAEIAPGDWVHSHNLSAGEFTRQYAPCSAIPPDPEPIVGRTFQGYRRSSGRAGTRNYVAVISTVNCSASACKLIARRFDESLLRQYPNIDGIMPIAHQAGCGMQFGGLGHEMLNRTLAGIARHPNVGAFLLVGLGCEQGAMSYLVDSQKLVQIDGFASASSGPPVLIMQETGGTERTVAEGCRRLAELLPWANDVRREPIPASEIVLGCECGGSDGSSGITANPALGFAADMVVAAGGTAILSETTEVYGAEQLLVARARTPAVAEKLLERIRWWEWYTSVFGSKIDGNPSTGNKAGGLTTIYEKSLGAISKGGTLALEAVYEYAEPVAAKGFVFMDTPGYDPPSVTGMVAGGANVVVFTTGRGSCFGCKPTPSIKLATNTPMFERMRDDMDLNAGEILIGRSVADVGREIFEEILAVASGKKTKSEQLGIGDEEFVPWIVGPVL
ncbi:MAG: galactonate dehydratase [Planctomycetota bacterium]|nr:MAG: galactonate dehydratase [Planctomycetota bacterium]